MTIHVDLPETLDQLALLIARIKAGEDILLAQNGVAIAHLTPIRNGVLKQVGEDRAIETNEQVSPASEDENFLDTLTWRLCGSLEVSHPEPEYIVGQDAIGRPITNYSEHVDDVIY